MPYLERAGGSIVAAYELPQPHLDQATLSQVPADDPDYLSFLRWKTDDLERVREQALEIVDMQAGKVRRPQITTYNGQSNVYVLKAEEARHCLQAYDAENPPPAGLYLMLEAEVPSTAPDVLGVAQVIFDTERQFVAEAAAVEAVRMPAKADIRDAADIAAIEFILDNLAWPDLSLVAVDPPPAT